MSAMEAEKSCNGSGKFKVIVTHLPSNLADRYKKLPIMTEAELRELGCAVESAMEIITKEDK